MTFAQRRFINHDVVAPVHIEVVARRTIVVVVAASFLGCTPFKNFMGFRGEATPPPSSAAPTAAASTQRVYYANVEGLKVYSAPSASSQTIGTLSLHEQVLRSKVERGYAYVKGTKTGVEGWVDNGALVWRIPTAPASTSQKTPNLSDSEPGEERNTGAPAAPPETTEEGAAPTTTLETEPPATTTTLPSTPSDSGAPSPSILDSY